MGCIEARRGTLLKKRSSGPITVKLIPGDLEPSNASYVQVLNEDNGLTDTDSTTYATVNHTRASSTSTYYIHVTGFDFSVIPATATILSYTIRLKASMTGLNAQYNTPTLRYGSTSLAGTASSAITGTVQTITFSGVTSNFNNLRPSGSNYFYIRCGMRRSSSRTTGTINLYGAEIEVTYTLP